MREEQQSSRTEYTWPVLFSLAAAVSVALLQWGQPLHWDELEFTRATRWIAGGRMPYRDYWEHHLPLQWLLFAPFARLVSGGAQAVLALRWAQLPMWIGIFAILFALMRRLAISVEARWASLTLLLSSFWFTRTAVQYRVDVPGHLAYLAGIWLIERAPFASGALFSLAVLANIRLAPLVVVTVLVFFRARIVRVIAGGAAVALAATPLLLVDGFKEGVLWYNRTSDPLMPGTPWSFVERLAGPILQRDPAGIAFLLAGIVGVAHVIPSVARDLGGRRHDSSATQPPGSLATLGMTGQFAILSLAAFATVAALGVEYDYHFHTALLLLAPLAAIALDKVKRFVPIVVVAGLLMTLTIFAPTNITWQDEVMRAVDRVTQPSERVWDSTGYALNRQPAYRYWFLPAGVRVLAQRHLIEDYDLEQMIEDPPAAIVFNDRTRFWFNTHPRLAGYARQHYLPLYQGLWIPGMSGSGPWIVPKTGRYDVYVSDFLPKHPWFSRWSDYSSMHGIELEIPLDRLPKTQTLDLKKGQRLAIDLPPDAGVLIVPHGVRSLSRMPAVWPALF